MNDAIRSKIQAAKDTLVNSRPTADANIADSVIPSSRIEGMADTIQAALDKAMGPEVTMADILSNADRGEIGAVQTSYHNLLDAEIRNVVSRMHHRAHILRLCAKEMDEEANALATRHQTIVSADVDLLSQTNEAEERLRSVSHIEPKQVYIKEKG